jgi:hypothetical protein
VPALIATHRGELERYYTCPRCGARGEMKLTAIGRSAWGGGLAVRLFGGFFGFGRSSNLGTSNAQDDAETNAQRDADRVLALVRCPSCHKRPRTAFVWPALRIAGLVAIVQIGLWLGGVLAPLWLTAAAVGALGAVLEAGRFRRASRVAALKLAPGTSQLPDARVIEAPVKRAIAPPPQAAAPAPGAEPSLLGTVDDD